MQFNIGAIVALVFNISLNNFLVSVLTNRICIKPTRPKIPSPQSLLDHRVPPKDLFRRNYFSPIPRSSRHSTLVHLESKSEHDPLHSQSPQNVFHNARIFQYKSVSNSLQPPH